MDAMKMLADLQNTVRLERLALSVVLAQRMDDPFAACPTAVVPTQWQMKEAFDEFLPLFSVAAGPLDPALAQGFVDTAVAFRRAGPGDPAPGKAHRRSLHHFIEALTTFTARDVRRMERLLEGARPEFQATAADQQALETAITLSVAESRALAVAAARHAARVLDTVLRQAGLDPSPARESLARPPVGEPELAPLVARSLRSEIEAALDATTGDLRALLLWLWLDLVDFEAQWRLFLESPLLAHHTARFIGSVCSFERTWAARSSASELPGLRIPNHLDRTLKLVAQAKRAPVPAPVRDLPFRVELADDEPVLHLEDVHVPVFRRAMDETVRAGTALPLPTRPPVLLTPGLENHAFFQGDTLMVTLDGVVLARLAHLGPGRQQFPLGGALLRVDGDRIDGATLLEHPTSHRPYVQGVATRVLADVASRLPEDRRVPMFRHIFGEPTRIAEWIAATKQALGTLDGPATRARCDLLDTLQAPFTAFQDDESVDVAGWDKAVEDGVANLARAEGQAPERARRDEQLRRRLDVEALPVRIVGSRIRMPEASRLDDLRVALRHALVRALEQWRTLARGIDATAADHFQETLEPILLSAPLDIEAALAPTLAVLDRLEDDPSRSEALVLADLGHRMRACAGDDEVDAAHALALVTLLRDLEVQARRMAGGEAWWREVERVDGELQDFALLRATSKQATSIVKRGIAAAAMCRVQPENAEQHLQEIAAARLSLGSQTPDARWFTPTLDRLLEQERERAVENRDARAPSLPDVPQLLAAAREAQEQEKGWSNGPAPRRKGTESRDPGRPPRGRTPWEPLPHTRPGARRQFVYDFGHKAIPTVWFDDPSQLLEILHKEGGAFLLHLWTRSGQVTGLRPAPPRDGTTLLSHLGQDRIGDFKVALITLPRARGLLEVQHAALLWDGKTARYVILENGSDAWTLAEWTWRNGSPSGRRRGPSLPDGSIPAFLTALHKWLGSPGGDAERDALVTRFPTRAPEPMPEDLMALLQGKGPHTASPGGETSAQTSAWVWVAVATVILFLVVGGVIGCLGGPPM